MKAEEIDHVGLLKLKKIRKSEFDPVKEAKAVLKRSGLASIAVESYVIGSAAGDGFSQESDIDILVVFNDLQKLQEMQKVICDKSFSEWPIDWILKTKTEFDHRSEIGGICYLAKQSGIQIK